MKSCFVKKVYADWMQEGNPVEQEPVAEPVPEQMVQNVQAVAFHPWLLTPVMFVIITVLAFNFVGDGLRDAADPYAT